MRCNLTVRIITSVLCLILMLPILVVLTASVNDQSYLSFPPESLSLRWFNSFFGDLRWRNALYTSLIIGFLTCLLSTTIGFLGAYSFVRGRYRGKKLLLSIVLMPLIVPHI